MPEPWEKKFDAHMKRLEERIEEIGKQVEVKGEEIGKKAQTKAKDIQREVESQPGMHTFLGGIVLIVIGLIWLGNNLGWIEYDIPWVPVVMIVIGAYLILKHHHSGKDENNP
jgi:hypothetical protein